MDCRSWAQPKRRWGGSRGCIWCWALPWPRSRLCLVKLCGTHSTSAFSVSGIHCYNYAIMGLYFLASDCTPSPPHLRNASIMIFFFPLSVSATLLVRYLLLVILAPTALLYLMWLYFCVFGSQVWSTSALFWLCEGLISSFKSMRNACVCVFHGNSTVYKALCQTEHTQKYRLGSRPLKMHSYPLSPTLLWITV